MSAVSSDKAPSDAATDVDDSSVISMGSRPDSIWMASWRTSSGVKRPRMTPLPERMGDCTPAETSTSPSSTNANWSGSGVAFVWKMRWVSCANCEAAARLSSKLRMGSAVTWSWLAKARDMSPPVMPVARSSKSAHRLSLQMRSMISSCAVWPMRSFACWMSSMPGS